MGCPALLYSAIGKAIGGDWHSEKAYAKAFDLFLQAAFAGNFAGAINLAVAYEKGEGVEVDSKEARKWLEMAADYGSSKAMP